MILFNPLYKGLVFFDGPIKEASLSQISKPLLIFFLDNLIVVLSRLDFASQSL